MAVSRGIVAVAIEADTKTDPGAVALFDTNGNFINIVGVGALPDMLTFTPNGRTLLVANEGEPDEGVDPEGSVSVIDVRRRGHKLRVRTADFSAFNSRVEALWERGVRVFPDVANTPLPGDSISLSQDLEPEYIAVDSRGRTAMVTLQEANAFAVVDIRRATVTDIIPLGSKDHSELNGGLDLSLKIPLTLVPLPRELQWLMLGGLVGPLKDRSTSLVPLYSKRPSIFSPGRALLSQLF